MNCSYEKKSYNKTSGQDGGVSRYILTPPTITNLKTKNNQNFQKIELYGSLTTKELKKKHSSKLVRGVETDSQGGEDTWQSSGWRTGQVRPQLSDWAVPYLYVCR